MMHDLTDLYERTLDVIERARLDAPGAYARHAATAAGREQGLPDPYGVSNAANLCYTLGVFPEHGAPLRSAIVDVLRGMQDARTGLYSDGKLHPYHTTAHCLGALELFDAPPLHPLAALEACGTPHGICELLESLDWAADPWSQSHIGAGAFASLHLAGHRHTQWADAYFDWLAEQTDPRTGLLRRGHMPGDVADAKPIHHHMGSTFHYLFNTLALHRPIPHAEALVDTCLHMHEHDTCPGLTDSMSFITVDWIYCVNRAARQSGHRLRDTKQAMADVGTRFIAYLRAHDPASDVTFNDLHCLFGSWCALAELQQALPGVIRTPHPLRLVLDRRPFV